MEVGQALDIRPGACIAVVGAGGKTSLCWLLTQEIAGREERVIFTTTTRIRQPLTGAFDTVVIGPAAMLPAGAWHTACIASGIDGAPDDRPLRESLMPIQHTKLQGYSTDQLDALYRSLPNLHAQRPIPYLQSPISLLIEADGARGLWLKAPATHEPVIPAYATTVCVVANLNVLGMPLDERTVHRPDRVAQLTGLSLGDPIGADALVVLLAHRDGGLKGIPAAARAVAVLMQRDEHAAHPDAAYIAKALHTAGYDHVIVLSPRATPPRVLLPTS